MHAIVVFGENRPCLGVTFFSKRMCLVALSDETNQSLHRRWCTKNFKILEVGIEHAKTVVMFCISLPMHKKLATSIQKVLFPEV